MTLYKRYLMEGVLPDDKGEVNKLKEKACDYCIHRESLYRKGKKGPDLKCVTEAKS